MQPMRRAEALQVPSGPSTHQRCLKSFCDDSSSPVPVSSSCVYSLQKQSRPAGTQAVLRAREAGHSFIRSFPRAPVHPTRQLLLCRPQGARHRSEHSEEQGQHPPWQAVPPTGCTCPEKMTISRRGKISANRAPFLVPKMISPGVAEALSLWLCRGVCTLEEHNLVSPQTWPINK